jgi:hypothetical protein
MSSKAPMKQNNETTNALATNNYAMSTQGMDLSDIQVPVAAFFQGTPKEQKRFPDLKIGQIVDKLSGQAITNIRFVPIHVYKTWVKFTKGEGLIYIKHREEDVPEEDLVWPEGGSPAASLTYNYYLLFEGMPYPVVWRFKKTSLNAGKHLNTLENLLRKAQGKGVGLYEMNGIEKESADGPYIVPDIRPVGDPPAEMLELAAGFGKAISSGAVSEIDDEPAPF